jgi:hypothetical protein
MKKKPKVNNRLVRSHAYVAGRIAFEQNRRRVYNPYRNIDIELASSWWQGWDTAEEESHEGQRNREA